MKTLHKIKAWFALCIMAGSSMALTLQAATSIEKMPIEELTSLASSGNAEAQYWLGTKYGIGKDVSKDTAEEVKWYAKAAEQGHLESLKTLGFMYNRGFKVPKDHLTAIEYYRKAAEQGDVGSHFNLGVIYVESDESEVKNITEAIRCFQKVVEQGKGSGGSDIHAMLWLGEIYYKGDGIPKNVAEAAKWFEKAAKRGKNTAQYYLGKIYCEGGVPSGFVATIFSGNLSGKIEGLAWYYTAKANGYDESSFLELISELERELQPNQVRAAQERAQELFKKIQQSQEKK